MAKNQSGQGALWLIVVLGFAMLAFLIAIYVFEVAIRAPEGLREALGLALVLSVATRRSTVKLLCEVCLRNPAGESGVCGHCEHRTTKRERIIKTRKQHKRLDE
jgi:hypothetical protein